MRYMSLSKKKKKTVEENVKFDKLIYRVSSINEDMYEGKNEMKGNRDVSLTSFHQFPSAYLT